MKFKNLVFFGINAVSVLGVLLLTGCGCSDSKNPRVATLVESSYVTSGSVVDQFAEPIQGEEIAVLTVKDYGTIKCKLFPEVAPLAVKNFTELAKEGKYNGVSFHRVIKDFMIQTGGQNKSIYDTNFKIEVNPSVHHYNGALCVARNNSKSKGQNSQFYIVSSDKGKTADFDKIAANTNKSYNNEGFLSNLEFSDEVRALYKEKGGAPELDGLYTVMGQVYEGFDVVQKIAECPKKPAAAGYGAAMKEESVPDPEITLEKVEIVTF